MGALEVGDNVVLSFAHPRFLLTFTVGAHKLSVNDKE